MGAAKNLDTCASVVFGQVEFVGNLALTIATAGSCSPASAASSVANASRLGELKRKYQQLISALHAAKTAFDAAHQAKDVHDVTTSAIELNIHDVVTE